jgi:hypothetical protein
MRLPLTQFAVSSLGLLALVWFHAHYAGPLLATLVLLVVQGLRHLQTWRFRQLPVGIASVRLIALFSILTGPASFLIARSTSFFRFWLPSVEWLPPRYTLALLVVLLALVLLGVRNYGAANPAGQATTRLATWEFVFLLIFVWQACIEQRIAHPQTFPQDMGDFSPSRTSVERRLTSLPGDHLVIVRYSSKHSVHQEYVYNDAEIDHAKTVWTREIPGQDLGPLLTYFRNRDVWVLEPDQHPERLYPYSPPQPAP